MRKYLLIPLLFLSSWVNAGPILNTLVAGADPLVDDGAIGWNITDNDGINDDINSYIFLESAGLANENKLGLYSTLFPAITLQVFDGAANVGTSATIAYSLGTFGLFDGVGTNSITDFSGEGFGLYLENSEGMFYSDPLLNADGFDHFIAFNTVGSTGIAGLFDYVVGIEDIYGGGDQDYNDMVIGLTDVDPRFATVPEPAPLALMGFGLLFMRRQILKARTANQRAKLA